MAPTLVIGVRHPFRNGACTAPAGRAAGSANWGSDPKNQLPPEGAAAPADWQSQIRGPGWSGSEGPPLAPGASGLVFYTTGRLTSEMVIKSAQMGVPIVVSRSGITQMGHQVAQAVGLCAIGRATNKRFVCYANPQRLKLQPELAGPRLRASVAES